MGIGSFFRRLVGDGGATSGPWAGATDEDLLRLWRARLALTPGEALRVQEAIALRGLPFPLYGLAGSFSPRLTGIDKVLEREPLLRYLARLDPYGREADPAVVPLPDGVLVECGPETFLRVRLRLRDGAAAPEPPPGRTIVREIDASGSASEPFEVGRLRVVPREGYVDVLDPEEELRVVVGSRIPAGAVGGEIAATYLLGGFSFPVTDEDAALLEASGWTPAESVLTEAVYLAGAAEGVDLAGSRIVAGRLDVQCRQVGAEAAPGPLPAEDEDPILQANRAFALWRSGDREAAVDLLQESEIPTRSWLGGLVLTTVHEGDPAAADPGDLSRERYHAAPFETGLEALAAGDFERGEALLREALRAEPLHAPALGVLGTHLLRAGRAEECLAVLGPPLERAPCFALLRYLSGLAQLELGRLEAAAGELRRAIDLVPEDPEWCLTLAEVFLRLGRPDAARAELRAFEDHGGDHALAAAARARFS